MAERDIRVNIGVDGAEIAEAAVGRFSGAVGRMAAETQSSTGRMSQSFKDMAAAFTAGNLIAKAIEVIIEKLGQMKQYLEDSAKLAARVETLGAVMKTVGANAGYTSSQMDEFVKQVRNMGITSQESMASIIKMAGGQMNLAKASDLARVAQDSAVIGNINSSEAFGRMIQGIRSGETEILRNIGINVQFEQAYKKSAAALGKTSEQLTDTEKTTARMNAVLDFGVNIAGAYETSMSTASKQMLSMARYSEELKLKFGQMFTPALTLIIAEMIKGLKDLDDSLGKNRDTVSSFGTGFADAFRLARRELSQVSALLDKMGGTATGIMAAIYGPGMMAGNKNSTEQFNKWMDRNKMYEDRYKANLYQRVEDTAALQYGTSQNDPSEQAWIEGRRIASETSKITAGNAAREAADRAARLESGKKSAELWRKAEADLNSEITKLDPTLLHHEKALDAINNKYNDLFKQFPANRTELEGLKQRTINMTATNEAYKWELESVKAMEHSRVEGLKEAAKAAEEIEKESLAAIKASRDYYKASKDAELNSQRLSLQMTFDQIGAQEKFYEITSGDAAIKKLDILQRQLVLEKEVMNAITEDTAAANLLRNQQLDRIQKINIALTEQQNILKNQSAMGGAIAALKEYARAAQDIGSQTKSVVTDFMKGMEDALVDFVQNGKLSFKSLVDSIISDLARIAIKQSITGPLSNWLGNLFSGSGSGGSSGGGINWGGMVSSLGSAIGSAGSATGWSWLSGLGSSIAGLGSSGATGLGAGSYGVLASDAGYTWGATSGASAGASAGSSAASSFGGLGYGPYAAMAVYTYNWLSDYLGAGGVWNQHTTDQKMQLGFANTNPLAPGAAWWADSLTGGKFAGTNWGKVGEIYTLGVTQGEANAQQWNYFQREKSFGRGHASMLMPGAVNEDLNANLQMTLENIIGSIVNSSRSLGGDTSALRNLNIGQRVLFMGWDQQANMAQFTKFFTDATDSILTTLYPEITNFVKRGETVTDTFNRLSQALITANDFFTAIGATLYDVSVTGAAASQMLIDALGGLEKAQAAFNTYLNSGLFTEAEKKQAQYEVSKNSVNRVFSDLGMAVPATAEEFKALVNSALEAGAAGAYTASALLEISPAFGTMMNYITEGQKAALEAAQATFNMYEQLRKSALDAISAITGGSLSILSPEQKYAQAQAAFNNASLLSAAGDTTAMQGLPDVVTKFLEASRAYNASTSAYGSDYAAGLAALQGVADYSAIQMYPVSAPASGTADNQALITEVQALKAEMAKVVAKLTDIESPLKRVANA